MAESRGAYQTAVSAASICLLLSEDAWDLHVTLGDLNLDDRNLKEAGSVAKSFAAQCFVASMMLLDEERREEAAEEAYRHYGASNALALFR